MKLFMALGLSILLLVTLAAGAFASTAFTFDYLYNGVVGKSGLSTSHEDIGLKIISGGTVIDRFKLGAEVGFGNKRDKTSDAAEDLSLWSVKGGYRFLDARATKLDATLALLNITTDSNRLNSTILGLDFTQFFSEKFFISGAAMYSVGSSTYEFKSSPLPFVPKKDDTAPTKIYRLKFNYLVSDNWALSLGYTTLQYNVDIVTPAGTKLGTTYVGLGGTTLGVLYKF